MDKGLERFERPESTAAHHEAVEMLVCKTRDVGEMLSDSYALETCRKMLSVIISFLGWHCEDIKRNPHQIELKAGN